MSVSDPIFFFGGIAFIVFGLLARFDRDRLWKIYQLDRAWRRANPERKPAWDKQTARYGILFLIVGSIGVIAGL